jgi:hypothetical protein
VLLWSSVFRAWKAARYQAVHHPGAGQQNLPGLPGRDRQAIGVCDF